MRDLTGGKLATKVKLVATRKGGNYSFLSPTAHNREKHHCLMLVYSSRVQRSTSWCPEHVDVGGQCTPQIARSLNLQGLHMLINILVICIRLTNVLMV